jgi:hypothetical protein
MSDERTPGYYLERIFSSELLLNVQQPEEGTPPDEGARVGWDWFAHSATVFDVMLRVEVAPTENRHELVKAAMVGRFECVGQPTRPTFVNFIMQNAPAMLSPYLREAVSALTMRGPFGPTLLPPMNVIEVVGRVDLTKSLGYARLREHPELAASYGIALPSESEVGMGSIAGSSSRKRCRDRNV